MQTVAIPDWHVLYVQPKTELKCEKMLQEAGIAAYVPVQRHLRQQRNRKRWCKVVLFSGYVFIEANCILPLTIFDHKYIKGRVRFNGKPAVIRGTEIELIRMLCADERPIVVGPQVQTGQTVEIQAGPFIGYRGVVQKVGGKNKFFVKLFGLENFGYIEYELQPGDTFKIIG